MCTKCHRQDGAGWRAGSVLWKPNQPFLRKKLHESEMTGFSSSSSTISLPANHCTLAVEWEWSPPLRCADDTGEQDFVWACSRRSVCADGAQWKCGCGQELFSWVSSQARLKILLFIQQNGCLYIYLYIYIYTHTHTYIHILFLIFFSVMVYPRRLDNSLYYRVTPCCLSILYMIVYIC